MAFTFFSIPPSPALAPFVQAIWGVRGSAHYHVESVVPNGAMELMVNFGPPQAVVGYGDRSAADRFEHAWLAGMQDRRLVHAAHAGSDHIAVRFRPGGGHAFFDLPMDEVTNRVVPLDALIGAAAVSCLRDRLGETTGDVARCREFERWLLERRASVHPYFATVRRAVDLLRGHAHGLRVTEVCERLGLSNRHLIKQFRRTVGIAPKTYARIERLQSAIEACRGRAAVSWSRVAAQCGYADQSHLIREFRRLACVSPSEFLARRTPDESHVVVA